MRIESHDAIEDCIYFEKLHKLLQKKQKRKKKKPELLRNH